MGVRTRANSKAEARRRQRLNPDALRPAMFKETSQREISNARKRLAREGYARCVEDINRLDYSVVERADILLPGGAREVWLRPRKLQSN